MTAAMFADLWVYCTSTEMVEVYEDAMQDVDPEYVVPPPNPRFLLRTHTYTATNSQ